MTVHLMPTKFVILPTEAASLLLLAVVGLSMFVELRQGHIGRPAIIANAMLLWQVFLPSWSELPTWLQWYLNAGTIVAAFALVSYVLRLRMPTAFYKGTFLAYGSFTVLVLVAALVQPWRPWW
jgi:hypothetical protein